MLAYAANRPVPGKRQSSPNVLLLVVSAHVALVAVVMSAKMDLPARIAPSILHVRFVPNPVDPPPEPAPVGHPVAQPLPSPRLPVPLPLPPSDGPVAAIDPVDAGPVGVDGGGASVVPEPSNPIRLAPVRQGPRLLTPASELKPPYPASKLASEQEAVLTLKLSIDDRGRVIAVDPLGPADRVFVEAARRHLIAHWRYAPATADGKPVATALTITLRFMLDG